MGCSSISYLNLRYLELSHLKLSYVKLSEAKHCGEAREAGWGGHRTRGGFEASPGHLTWTFAEHQWASHQAKKSQNKTPEIFFQAAFDFDAPRLQNTAKK